MDGFNLFRKLGVGAKFDLKRFQKDAERLKLVKPNEESQISEKQCSQNELINKKRKADLTEISSDKIKRVKSVHESEKLKEDSKMETSESEEEKDDEEEDQNTFDKDISAELRILGNIMAKDDNSSQKSEKQKQKERKKTAERLAAIRNEEINHFRKQHRIHVYGTDMPYPVSSFEELESRYRLHPKVIRNIQAVGYETPTPIQMQAIPAMCQRRELMACAPTGSGKTAAFILPLLHHLKEPRNKGVRALVLAPTRELGKQIHREFQRLSEGMGLRILYIQKATTATKKLGPKSAKKCDILVSTPNRLIHMLKQDPPLINLSNVEWLVIDESDKLFEEGQTGFRDQLAVIYKACDCNNIRRAMFSATFAFDVEEWCRLHLDNVLQVYIGARNSATELIEQELQFVGTESGKMLAFRDIVRKGIQPPVLIFVQSKDRAKELYKELVYDGMNVDVIHADKTQVQRDNVVRSFRAGKTWILICTELMGRGIDFKGINLVINYDFPNSAIAYIHRIGRTGRAGRPGRAVTFFTEDDATNLRSIANVMKVAGCPVPEYMLQLKQPSKKNRRILSKRVPKRQRISTLSAYDIQRAKRKRNFVLNQKNKKSVQMKSTETKKTTNGSEKVRGKSTNNRDSGSETKNDKLRTLKKERRKV